VSRLSPGGIGGVRFGATKAATVAELSRILGPPSRRFVSDACGPRYTEVEWSDLYAEFRLNRFSGYRYMRADWLPRGVVPVAGRSRTRPQLATAKGISLDSTLQQVRARYGAPRLIGTDRWQSRNGLVFYVSFTTPQPPAPSSRITEIKSSETCGDF